MDVESAYKKALSEGEKSDSEKAVENKSRNSVNQRRSVGFVFN